MNNLYRFFETLPGIISWSLIGLAVLMAYLAPTTFVFVIFAFTLYWVFNAFRIAVLARKGLKKIEKVSSTDWTARLEAEYPEWKDYYYCAILPYASESINVLRPTVQSIADSKFPKDRTILLLSSEKALPKGKAVAEELQKEFQGRFAHIFITEHVLQPGELKGKASNQNHAGRFLYAKAQELGLDPKKILFSSNDADVLNDPQYPSYLLHTYLSAGPDRDSYIYQPIPTDYNNFWNAKFFSRVIISTGVLWRIALQTRADYRCTVYAFYSMTLQTLHNIGYWDTDLIPEDERTMFKAILAFGSKFKVIPLFMLTRGSPVSGADAIQSFREQYVQIRRWAWGASEFAHSMSHYLKADKDRRKALSAPIFNQLRTSTEWSLSSLILLFGGALPGLFHPEFAITPVGLYFSHVLSFMMSVTFVLVIGMISMDRRLAPPVPENKGRLYNFMTYAQWVAAPVIGLILSALPAMESQTRMIFNRRIAYVESRKEPDGVKKP